MDTAVWLLTCTVKHHIVAIDHKVVLLRSPAPWHFLGLYLCAAAADAADAAAADAADAAAGASLPL